MKWNETNQSSILAWPLTTCLTLGKLFMFGTHLFSSGDGGKRFKEETKGVNEKIYVKHNVFHIINWINKSKVRTCDIVKWGWGDLESNIFWIDPLTLCPSSQLSSVCTLRCLLDTTTRNKFSTSKESSSTSSAS